MEYFTNIFKKKWISDSIDPYSLQTMTDYIKDLHRVFPYHKVAFTINTKEEFKMQAVLSRYVNTKIYYSMASMLLGVTKVQWVSSFKNTCNWNVITDRDRFIPTNYRSLTVEQLQKLITSIYGKQQNRSSIRSDLDKMGLRESKKDTISRREKEALKYASMKNDSVSTLGTEHFAPPRHQTQSKGGLGLVSAQEP